MWMSTAYRIYGIWLYIQISMRNNICCFIFIRFIKIIQFLILIYKILVRKKQKDGVAEWNGAWMPTGRCEFEPFLTRMSKYILPHYNLSVMQSIFNGKPQNTHVYNKSAWSGVHNILTANTSPHLKTLVGCLIFSLSFQHLAILAANDSFIEHKPPLCYQELRIYLLGCV
jgi:hypothetical protein